MPNINEMFPSRFLKPFDLQGKEPNVTIARVELVAMGWGATRETKPVVYFAGKEKGLKLNKTVATAIAAIAGTPLTEQWAGVKVCLFGSSAKFGKDEFAVVRVKASATGPRLVTAPAAVQAAPAAVATKTHPRGYLAWFDTLRAAAMGGTAALEGAWAAASVAYRQHLTMVAPATLDELRLIAGRLAGAGTRAS